MGVSRLHRFIAERYPYAIRTVSSRSHHVDELYIDFNSLVHESTNRAAYVSIDRDEETVLNATFSYLLELLQLFSPKYVFIAIDGTAPNAKIREQRERRVLGAIEADSQKAFREKIAGYGEAFQAKESLSTAEITPGTPFMNRLTSFLIAKIAAAIDEGEIQAEVVLSDSTEPGEGEHKILQQLKDFYKKQQLNTEKCAESHYPVVVSAANKKKFKLEDASREDIITIEPSEQDLTFSGKRYQLKGNPNIPEIGVFSMDGDMILLCLGLNMPELTLFKRFPGLMVHEIESVEISMQDPWSDGIIGVDISALREGILYELLQPYFEDPQELMHLARYCSDEGFINECVAREDGGTTAHRNTSQFKALLRERIIHSAVSNRLIHDFIALALFVGNDFVPEVPGQSIKNGALDELMRLYERNNLKEIQFKFLLNESKQFDLAQIQQMFELIGSQLEYTQVINDCQDFVTLADKVKELSETFKADIAREYAEMRDEVGEGVMQQLSSQRMEKIKKDDYLKQKIMNFYRRKYYQKFDQLQLKDPIQYPQSLNQAALIDLALLDEYENLLESGKKVQNEMVDLINQSIYCITYKGLHHLIRTYLKTMEWVLYYYLDPSGIKQWSWEFDYPFTPLCSDMAQYCQLFKLKISTWNQEIEAKKWDQPIGNVCEAQNGEQQGSDREECESFDSNVEDVKQPPDQKAIEIELSDQELQYKYLRFYKGPKFVFLDDRPHDTLTQLVFTVPKQKLSLIPDEILEHLDQQFFDREPSYQTIEIAHYESAFRSLNERLDLSKPNLDFLQRHRQQNYGFGWLPNFSCFYKHYPLGVTDGIDFGQVQRVVERINKNSEYYRHYYAPIGKIVLCKRILSCNPLADQIQDYDVLASPESEYVRNQYKWQKDPKSAIFDQFIGKGVGSVYILKEKQYSAEQVCNALYFSFSGANAEVPALLEWPVYSKAVNLHLLSENGAIFGVERRKMNVVAENVNGNVFTAFEDTNKDDYTSSDSELKLYANEAELDKQIDNFMQHYNPFGIRSHENVDKYVAEQFAEKAECQLTDSSILSFGSLETGVVVGYFVQNEVFARERAPEGFGKLLNITKEFGDVVLKPLRFQSVQAYLQSLSETYYQMNKGRYVKNNAPYVLIQRCNCVAPRIQQWLLDLVNIRLLQPKTSAQYLAYLDNLNVVPVPIPLIDRKLQRMSVLRQHVEDYAFICTSLETLSSQLRCLDFTTVLRGGVIRTGRYSDEQVREIAAALFEKYYCVVPRQAAFDAFGALAPAAVAYRRVAAQPLPEFNEQLIPSLALQLSTPPPQALGIHLGPDAVAALAKSIDVTCDDNGIRDLGLSVISRNSYDPNYLRDGRPTLLCLQALKRASAAFPRLFSSLARHSSEMDKVTIRAFDCGGKREAYQKSTNVQPPRFNFGGTPVYNDVPSSNIQLANVITAASLYLHKLVVPVERAYRVSRSYTQVLPQLAARKLRQYVEASLAEQAAAQPGEARPQDVLWEAHIGNIVWSRLHGLLVVVAVSERSFIAIGQHHLFSLNNAFDFNAVEGVYGEEFYLVGDWKLKVESEFSKRSQHASRE